MRTENNIGIRTLTKSVRHIVVALLGMFCATGVAQEEERNPCVEVFKDALLRRIDIKTQRGFAADFKNYLLSETFRSAVRSGAWGGGATIPVEGIPVTLNANHSEDEYRTFREKITAWNSTVIREDFCQSVSASFPASEMAREFNNCLDRINPKSGMWIRAEAVSDKFANFKVYYRKLFDRNPTPILRDVRLFGGTILQSDFKVGERVRNETLVFCQREANADLIFNIQTDQDAVTYKLAAKSPDFVTIDSPVGTIIASFLTFEQFQKHHEGGRTWQSDLSKWAPCDGREVPKSKFETFASQTRVPDLRGAFLRGLNVMDPYPPASVRPLSDDQKDPDQRNVGSFQNDQLKKHSHRAAGSGGFVVQNGNRPAALQPFGGSMQLKDTTEDNEDGGPETRPKNVAIYYYVRIN